MWEKYAHIEILLPLSFYESEYEYVCGYVLLRNNIVALQ